MKKIVLSAAVCTIAFSVNASSDFDSIYVGAGIGGSFLKTTADDVSAMKAHRFMGSLVVGGGKVFKNNTYLGGEGLLDFMKNRKKTYESFTADAKGFIPQVDVKLGYAARNDVLGYGKFGCAWSKVSFHYSSNDHAKNKTSFVLGVGAEKIFYKRFSTSVEADYNFGFNGDDDSISINNIKANKGWTVRALAKYNVKY